MRTYGRVHGRAIKPRQAALLTTLLSKIALPTGPFDPRRLMPGATEIWLEIGFGGGEHLAACAETSPDILMLGAEPFVNGVASLLRHVDARSLANILVHMGDGRDVLAALPAASLDRIFLLFPDPWPKARHRKRRLLQAPFVAEAARTLQRGGLLLFATDWADYVETGLLALLTCPDLGWTAQRPDDWRAPPAGHTPTRYQQKALGDCAPVWLEFQRL